MGIMDKLKKNSKIKSAAIMSESSVFKNQEMVTTSIPLVNIALSGALTGGITAGLTTLAGPSKHFKTNFALFMAAAYLAKYDDAALIFYDCEYGSPQSYFDKFGIDMSRVFHTPILDIEEMKNDISNQLDGISKSDKVIIVIDSIGNMASKKETEDAMEGKSVTDMTRAKQLKSLFRIVTPHLKLKQIPLIAINHTYQTQEMYSKAVVSGGTGIYYSSDNIWIIGRQQNKTGTEVTGYNFVINIEKSRFVREKAKLPVEVSWENGIDKYSGLLEIASAGNFIHKGKKGKAIGYSHMNYETGEVDESAVYYARETKNDQFWKPVLENPAFANFVFQQFSVDGEQMVDFSDIVEGVDDIDFVKIEEETDDD